MRRFDMQFVKNHKEKIFLCIFAILIMCIYVQNIDQLYLPDILDDELGYWGNAAYMVGYDWSEVMAGMSYYSYGYSFVLALLLKLFTSPFTLYRAAALFNVMFMVATFFLNYLIFRRLFEKISPILLQLCAFCFTLYSSYLVQSKIAWPETILLFMFSLVLFLLIHLNSESKIWKIIVLGISSIYIYVIHQRTLGILLSILIIIFVMFFLKRINRKQLFAFMLTCIVCFIASSWLKNELVDNLYKVPGEVLGNDYSSQIGKIKTLFTLSGLKVFIKALSGQVFYLGTSTFLLFYLGAFKSLERSFSCIKSVIKKIRKQPFEIGKYDEIYLFLLLCIGSTIVISSIFMTSPRRMDHLVYGRYNETLVAIVSGVGICSLIENQKKYLKVLFGSILIYSFSFLITKHVLMTGSLEVFHSTNAVALHNYQSNIVGALFVTILVSAVIFVTIYFQKKKMFFLVLPFIVCICIFLQNGNQVQANVIEAQKAISSIGKVLDYIPDDQIQTFFVKTNESYKRHRGHIQFLLLETPLLYRSREELLDNPNNKYIVSSNLEPVLFRSGQIIDLKVNEASCLLFYAHEDKINKSNQQLNIDPDAFFSMRTGEDNWSEGYLAYGPYLTFGEGEYSLDYEISLVDSTQEDLGHIDVSVGSSTFAYQKLMAKNFDKNDTIVISLPFSLSEETTHIEFRLFATANTQIEIHKVTVVKEE